jgi:uncharacterized protein (TIGR02611 family)
MSDPMRSFTRHGKRFAVTIVGVVVVIVGIILCPLPGPGIAIIIGGLAILATEYVWAKRLLHWVRDKSRQTYDKVRHRDHRDHRDGDTRPPDDDRRRGRERPRDRNPA